MPSIRLRIARIANLFRRAKVDREIEEELAAHLEMCTEDNVAAGMNPLQARREAMLRFGNVAAIRERTTEADAALYLESLAADLRYAARQLSRSPGFAVTAVLTLALGIGANLAVFQLLYGVLFAHLPVPHAEQLYTLQAVKTPFDGTWLFSYPAYRRLRDAGSNTKSDSKPDATPVTAHSWIGRGVMQESGGTSSSTTLIDFQLLSDNFFNVMQLSPYAGRFFAAGDDERDPLEWPVILRYGFFQQHFGSDRSVIGKRAVVNSVPVVIVGIAPKGFDGVLQWDAPDLWLPLAAHGTGHFGTWFDSLGPGSGVDISRAYRNEPGFFWLWPVGRVPDAAKLSAAALWTAALAPDISFLAEAAKDPEQRARIGSAQVQLVSAANGEGALRRRYSRPLVLLMAMAAVILLVGCLNLANLQMARLMQREREFAIRIALGASRARVLRQVAIESGLLAAVGGALAFVTGRVCSGLLLHWASGRGRPMAMNPSMGAASYLVGATLLLAVLAGFGLLPAWQMTRRSFSSAEKSRSAANSGQSKGARRWSNLLLAGQVSFSLLLISAAALFAQTLRNITAIDAGMDREHILSVHVDMENTGFADQVSSLPVFYDRLIDRLKALPGVSDAAVSYCDIPQCGWNTIFHVYGHPELSDARQHGEENHVGLDYFRTLGIALIEGREFSAQDTVKTQHVAVLNRSYARQLFGDESAVGRWIGYNAAPGDHRFLVVGVVADARVDGLRSPAPAVAYLSNLQDGEPAAVGTIEVRARGSLKSLPAEIRDALHEVAPALPITEIVPLNIELEDGLTTEELLARLTTVFGALALALAALGFYGVVSFRVARRTAEIGLRMALGATRNHVQSLFLRQTLAILVAGAVPGILLSLALHPLIAKLMFGPATMAFSSLAIACGVLLCVGLLATFFPARRAASVNPVEALRAE